MPSTCSQLLNNCWLNAFYGPGLNWVACELAVAGRFFCRTLAEHCPRQFGSRYVARCCYQQNEITA